MPPQESHGNNTFVFGSKENVDAHRLKVVQTLPESLQMAFNKKDNSLLGLALSFMTEGDQALHMNKCIECGLWEGLEFEPPSGVVRELWKGNMVSKPPSSPSIKRTRMNDPKTKDMEDMLNSSRSQRINKDNDRKKNRNDIINKKRAKNTPNEVKKNAGEEELGRTRSKTRFEEELRMKAGEKNNRVEELD